MKVSRWGPAFSRGNLIGLGTILLVWLCCSFDSKDEPPRRALASTIDNTLPELTTRNRNSATLGSADAARFLRKLVNHLGGAHSLVSGTAKFGGETSLGSGGTLAVSVASSTLVCQSNPSSYREVARFDAMTLPRRWGLNWGTSQAGATLISTKRGPINNPSLCADGCAVLSFTIPAGNGWGGGAIIDEWFATSTNLYGAAIRANVALEIGRPNLPVNVRIYTQGDKASNFAWGTTASLATSLLADVSRFHEIVLHAADRRGTPPYCASSTGAIGIQVQRSRSSNVDIPIKLYIRSVVVGDHVPSDNETPGRDIRTGLEAPRDSTNRAVPTFEGKDGYCRLAENGSLNVASDDWVVAGTCQGYGYTFAIGRHVDTKVTPACNASRCTPRLSKVNPKGICASGTLAADSTWKSKAGIGLDFDPKKAQTNGLTVSYQMMGTSILRFVLDDTTGRQFCVDLDETDDSGTSINVPWEALTTRCWDRWDPGISYNPTWPMKGIQLTASCLSEKNSWFDMCVTGLTTF